jgi:hypothetical protein
MSLGADVRSQDRMGSACRQECAGRHVCRTHERSQGKSRRRTTMVLKPSHRMALPASPLLIAMRTLASPQERRHTMARQLTP